MLPNPYLDPGIFQRTRPRRQAELNISQLRRFARRQHGAALARPQRGAFSMELRANADLDVIGGVLVIAPAISASVPQPRLCRETV